MFCPNCGKENGDSAAFCQACGIALEGKPAASAPSVSVSTTGSYAGFWIRFVAFIIDLCILALINGILTTVTFGAGVVLSFVTPWLYEAFMLSSEWQATVGKRAMSIVVTGIDGGRISFARA